MPLERARRHRRVGVGLVVLAAILASSVGAYPPVAHVGEVDFAICHGLLTASFDYQGNESGYLSDQYGLMPANCAWASLPPGASVTAGVLVHSWDPLRSHALTDVGLGPPYRLTVLSPAVPVDVPLGGNVTFTATFEVPPSPGTFDPPTAVVSAA